MHYSELAREINSMGQDYVLVLMNELKFYKHKELMKNLTILFMDKKAMQWKQILKIK